MDRRYWPTTCIMQCSRSGTRLAAIKSPALLPTPWSVSRKSRSSSGGWMRRPQCVLPQGCWLAWPTSGRELDSFMGTRLQHVGGLSDCINISLISMEVDLLTLEAFTTAPEATGRGSQPSKSWRLQQRWQAIRNHADVSWWSGISRSRYYLTECSTSGGPFGRAWRPK